MIEAIQTARNKRSLVSVVPPNIQVGMTGANHLSYNPLNGEAHLHYTDGIVETGTLTDNDIVHEDGWFHIVSTIQGQRRNSRK